MIEFGTDGWRAVIADTFTFENVRIVAQATADHILTSHTGDKTPSVVIGHDTRFLSDRFAMEVACVMAANGIIAWLSRADVPTPAVSFSVKAQGANAGVVITASHNPPRYNGYKVKASYGGSVTDAECKRIEENIQTMQKNGTQPKIISYEDGLKTGLICRYDPSWNYYQHLSTLVDMDKIHERELKIVADAMWGSGRGAFRTILSRTRSHVEDIRATLNPGFGGIHPEPLMRYLRDLVSAVSAHHADVGLATDGDADRIGAVDALGNFVDPHHIFALVLRHLIENKGQRGEIVKTISTTAMIDSIAEKHNLPLHVTPVGFNHIADLMMQKDILMGGEESGGISIRGHIPEGDGILMGLMLLEVMAYQTAPLHEIIADLQKTHGPACYDRNDVRLAKQLKKKEIVQRLQDNAPAHINGQSVTKLDTLDGIKFHMADRSWLLVRPSGTEPVLRIYAEAPTHDDVKALLALGDTFGEMVIG